MAGNERLRRVCLWHRGGHAHAPLPRIVGAAFPHPWQSTVLVSKIDEVVESDGQSYPLGSNRWGDGAIDPSGDCHIESFCLEGTAPAWTFTCADVSLEKRIWMEYGANTTYVQYTLVRAIRPLRLAANVLVN